MQQLVLTPLGIITQPNKLGQIPAGALADAYGVFIRSPGIVEPQPSWETIATLPSDAGTTCAFIVPTPSPYILTIYNVTAGWRYCWFNALSGAQVFGGPKVLQIENGETQKINTARQPDFHAFILGQQIFVSTYSQLLVWDTYEPVSTQEATVRRAGLMPPWFGTTFAYPLTSEGTAVEAQHWCAYTAVFRRTVGDKELVSEPAPACPMFNINNVSPGPARRTDVSVAVRFWTHSVRVGDRIEVYRTRSKPWDYTGGTYEDHQDGEEVGAEYLRVMTYTLTVADAAAGEVVLTDSTPEAQLTQVLYTNQAVGGAGAVAWRPPACRAYAMYKSHMFGFGPTYPGEAQVRVRGVWSSVPNGAPSNVRAGGIGNFYKNTAWTAGQSQISIPDTSGCAVGQWVRDATISTVNGYVTSVLENTAVFISPAPLASDSGELEFRDTFHADGSPLFAASWADLSTQQGAGYLFHALSLQLPPFNVGDASINAAPSEFLVSRPFLDDVRTPLTLQASRPQNWDPQLTITPDEAVTLECVYTPNAYTWCEANQPENWPRINFDTFTIGQIHAAVGTRDAIIVFASDGIWRLSGSGGTAGTGYDWRADLLATEITIAGTEALCVLHDDVYAYTSRGLIVIRGGSDFTLLTEGRLNDQLSGPPWTDGQYNQTTAVWMAADEEHGEVLLHVSTNAADIWVYNVATDTFVKTQAQQFPTHARYSAYLRSMLVIGKESSGGAWTVKSQTGGYDNAGVLYYQPIYGENPFVQRHWSTLDVAIETAGTVSVNTFFNSANPPLITRGNDAAEQLTRMRFDVPRDAPCVGNMMRLTLTIIPYGDIFRLQGLAFGIRDLTERSARR